MAKKESVRIVVPKKSIENFLELPSGALRAHPTYPDGTFSAVLQGLREGRGPISKIVDEHLAGEQAEVRPRRKVS